MKLKCVISAAVMCATAFSSFADISISDVKVFSGYPWKEVIIGYKITGTNDAPVDLYCRAKDNETGNSYECVSLGNVDISEGVHSLKWNAEKDGAKFVSSNVVFTLRLEYPMYLVVDLSGGTNASHFAVSYLYDVPSGGWTDEYKTTKLALRRIEAGSFILGDDQSDETHRVTLTQPFWIGVFEVTQRQWELVVGGRPSTFPNNDSYEVRPVETVAYDRIRGPLNSDTIDANSFVGILREKIGKTFDLPSEAQWEYACRAGTVTDFNDGSAFVTNYIGDISKTYITTDGKVGMSYTIGGYVKCDSLDLIGRYIYNSGNVGDFSASTNSATAAVGTYKPNNWGLYDMHGNVAEYCLGCYGPLTYGLNPPARTNGNQYVGRGGDFILDAYGCRATSRSSRSYSWGGSYIFGFRLLMYGR